MRVVVDSLRRVGDADRIEQLDRPLATRRLARLGAVGADRLGDLSADPVDRVERGHRVLEDHADLLAADLTQLLVTGLDQLLAAQPHRTLDPRVGRAREADQRLRGDAHSRARLADDRQHLSRGELEGDAVDRLHAAPFGDEADPQVVHPEQRLGAHWAESPSRIRGSR